MRHYISLGDYQFTEHEKDIRGATVHGADGSKLGTVEDVVFDHQDGKILYLILHAGTRKVGIPAGHIFRTLMDDNSFTVDMTAEESESLPEFDTANLRSQESWNEYYQRQEKSLAEWHREMERKYQHSGWHEAPVQHRVGSSRNITPDPEDIPSVPRRSSFQDTEDTEQDFTPHRIAGKFPGTEPGPAKVTMQPAAVPEEPISNVVGNERVPGILADAPVETGMGSPDTRAEQRSSSQNRWKDFEDLLRKNRVDISANCMACAPARDRAA